MLAVASRRLLASIALLALVGCVSHLPPLPRDASVGAAPVAMPSPEILGNDAPPRMLAMHFSSLDLRRGTTWSGSFVTSTNTASVEVRTNLFSIDVPRTAFGVFAFKLALFDWPPIFTRSYALRVIARNSAGVRSEQELPLVMQ
uniref:Lipoprotein n=1 Tax=mine drainage metagenome TaxID=410659 RepID=E6Q1D9_9ZZZZ